MKRPWRNERLRHGCLLICCALLALFLNGCGGGSSSTTTPTYRSGTWLIFHTTTGTTGDQGPDLFSLTIAADNTITGTTPQGNAVSGSVSGTIVTFSWTAGDGSSQTYTGEIITTNGTVMGGPWVSSSGPSGTWHAILSETPTTNISGNWNVFHVAPKGSGELGPDLFTFSEAGNTLTGTTSGGLNFSGAAGAQSIYFSWTGTDGITFFYTGTIAADGTITGIWTDTNNEGGTWRATRSTS